MSKLKVNSIVNRNDDGGPELTYGATIPAGQTFLIQGNANIVGVVTASSFSGSGANLTLPARVSISTKKTIALKRILGYDEYSY